MPKNSMLADFFRLCTQSERIAVHCRAGLGRTGTLIAASLIKFHGFTAAESIAWVRIVRPGSVMGYQQQYLQFIEGVFRIQVSSSPVLQPAQPPAVASSLASRARNALTSSQTLSAPQKSMPFSSLREMRPADKTTTVFSFMSDMKLRRETSNSSRDEDAACAKPPLTECENKSLSEEKSIAGSHIYARTGSDSTETASDKRDEKHGLQVDSQALGPVANRSIRAEESVECNGCAEQDRMFFMLGGDNVHEFRDAAVSPSASLSEASDTPISLSALSLWSKEKDKENVDRATRVQMILASQEKRIARRIMMQEKAKRA